MNQTEKKKILEYISQNIDMEQVNLAVKIIDLRREPLSVVAGGLYDQIQDLLEEYGEDHDLPEGWYFSELEIDDIIFELEAS